MEAVLSCKPEDLEDYYGLLGCDELSSTEQILNEYKIRALACHPDKHLNSPGAVADFQKLQEAKEVLCDENKRKNYDLWKRSGVTIPFHDWQALNDSVKTSMHWAVRNKKEPMLEASKPERPVASQAESFHCEQGETGKPSCESMPHSDLWYIFDLLAQQEGDGNADELFKSPSGVTFRPEELFSTRIKVGLHTHPVFCKLQQGFKAGL